MSTGEKHGSEAQHPSPSVWEGAATSVFPPEPFAEHRSLPTASPNLSPKGSITVLRDDELGFADLASPGTIENLRHNPGIELNVVDPFTRLAFRFKGRAEIVKNDSEAHRRIAQIPSEAEVKRFWLERYGYRSAR